MTLAVLLGAALTGLWLLQRLTGDDHRAEQRATSTFVPRFPQAPARESERP